MKKTLKTLIHGIGTIGKGFSTFEIIPRKSLNRKPLEPIKMIDYNYEDGSQKDAEALANDWQNVGNDMRKAINKFRQ